MNKINRAITKGLFVAVAAIGAANIFDAIYASIIVDAATSNITMAATINPSMTMEISDSSPELVIVPSSEGAFDMVDVLVSTYNNGSIGYDVVMTLPNTNLVGRDSSNVIPTLPDKGSYYSTSGFLAGYWGIAVDNTNFYPATLSKVIDTVSDTTTTSSGSQSVVFLGAKLDLSTARDVYTNVVTFAATPTIKTYNVTFNFDSHIRDVAIKDSTGTSTIGTVSTSGDSIALDYANSYTIVPTYHNGYIGDGMTLTGSGILSENGIFAVGAGSSTISLTSTERYYMQNISTLALESLMPNVGDTTTIYDKRDESSYTIAKLADGKYWMLDNLALDLTSSTVKANLSSSTTNATDTALGYLKNGGGSSPYAAAAVTRKPEAVIEDVSDQFWSSTDPQINTDSKDVVVTKFGNDGSGKVGIYYNACAASAGSRCGNLFTDISQDICPAGWRIPSGNTVASDYGVLRAAYNTNADFRNAFAASWSGYYSYDEASDQDSSGYWWSSTAVNDTVNNDYGLYDLVVIGSGNVYIYDMQSPENGLPIRCVTEGSLNIQSLEYMQDFASLDSSQKSTVLGSMTTDAQYKLYDSRDQKGYYVSKLADGKVWMTQNLDLDLDSTGTVELNSNNTDINQYGSNSYDSANGYSCSNADASCSGGVITWVPERSTIDGPSNLNSTSWVNDNNNPYSYNPGAGAKADPSDLADGHRLTGNYYNWTAAIASNYSGGFSSRTRSNVGDNPKNSICPKGWRLPTISDQTGNETNSTNEFKRLNILYNSGLTNNAANLMAAPLYLARSDYVSSGTVNGAGAGGYYWSSTVNKGSSAYDLLFNPRNVAPETSYNRGNGLSVRCVAY